MTRKERDLLAINRQIQAVLEVNEVFTKFSAQEEIKQAFNDLMQALSLGIEFKYQLEKNEKHRAAYGIYD